MAQNLKGWSLQEIAPAARQARILSEVLTPGVQDLVGGGFEVTTESAMYVKVGSGSSGDVVYVEGVGGIYAVRNPDAYIGDGVADVPISAGDATWNRHDIVILRVYDNDEDASGQNGFVIEVVEGTPSSTPSDPALPSGALALARVIVPANENTSIDAGDITDLRVQSSVLPQLLSNAVNRLDKIEETIIDVQTGDGTSTSLVFDALPQDFHAIRFMGYLGHSGGNVFNECRMRWQADSTDGNYTFHRSELEGTTRFDQHVNTTALKWRVSQNAIVEHVVIDYATATSPLMQFTRYHTTHGTATANNISGWLAGRYNPGGPVDNFRFFLSASLGETWKAGTKIIAYGQAEPGYFL